MTLCIFTRRDGVHVCTTCGRRVRAKTSRVIAACRASGGYHETNFRLARAQAGEGPGTELKRLLAAWFGITSSKGCRCEARAHRMNLWGCEGCEQRLDTIVGWLKEEAGRRGLPFVRPAAVALVRAAIRSARKP